MLIRPAAPEDSESIAEIFMRVWNITLAEFVPAGFLKRFAYETQKTKYAERAVDPNWILLVAVVDDKIVGFVGAKDNDAKPLQYQKQIRSMYVDPDWQRQGIGSVLFSAIENELKNRGSQTMMLWCIKANAKACSFYEKHGGKRVENVTPPLEYSEMPHVIFAWSS
jgi:GNAT superfamily N-acetyltransferase